jgi:2',3'-cyclic-nucleotide 2'-phosphodiesterase
MRILFIGDIVGNPGRKAARKEIARLKASHSPSLVIANGENAAGGFGITGEVAGELFGMGIDLITTGNHVWDKREVIEYIEKEERLLRPLNFPPGVPGRGSATVSVGGVRVGVINLMGRVFMASLDCPFRAAKAEASRLKSEEDAEVVIIDFHAEATSEKIALGRYIDGSVAAVLGTHTHVQTADEKLLPGGTAYITDVGMTGPYDSVIGVSADKAIGRFLNQMPTRFDTASGPCQFQAVLVDVDPDNGLATSIVRLNLPPE